MSKKTDFFQADRELSTRVAEFMRVNVWGITLRVRFKKEEEKILASLSALDNVEAEGGSRLFDESEADAIRERLEKKLADLRKKYEKQAEEEARFKFTDADKALFKAYKADSLTSGIEEFFSNYGLNVSEDYALLADFNKALAGRRKASARTIVNSDGEQWTQARSRNDILNTFYAILSEKLLQAGTLKVTEIPEDVRDFYAPKKKNNK